ncbi:MAG TPA: putative 2OG-Fe(II) oxygenase [Allosphingosinicella sp.]|nr:putative 2OG-Fe(II) oxygenase [Allosphingosinicella sp.]
MQSARPEDQGAKPPTSRQALALLLRGEIDRGLALYETCLKRPNAHNIPIGIHLLFLERGGLPEVAKELRGLALRRGGTVSIQAAKPGASPAEVVEEHEALFDRGIANGRMIFDYLVALARLGRMDEVRSLLDLARRLRTVRLDLPGPDGGPGGLAAAVQALLGREESRAVDRDSVQPLRQVPMLERLHRLDDPVARTLIEAFRLEADRYLLDWASSGHPFARLVSRKVDLKAWALFAREGGFSPRHLHPQGWATGVYYPAAPPGGGTGGELMIGPPEALEETAPGWPLASIRPEAGLLVLMPSYCMHWTLPFRGPGVRMSVAFDLLDPAPARAS